MSGHSHAKTVKRIKDAHDKKRGKIFSKLSQWISIVAAEKGGDPETNPALRLAINQAKEVNMPKENIERAIKRGTGEIKGGKLEEVLFEAYGPGGVAIIIEAITENKNRTLSEIKQILNQNNGKLVSEGAIKWKFEKKGCITINKSEIKNQKNKEELELAIIEAGAEDFCWQDDTLNVYTKIEDLEKVKNKLEIKKIKTESVSLDWIAKEKIEVDEKTKNACQKLFDALDENNAVQEIYSNLK